MSKFWRFAAAAIVFAGAAGASFAQPPGPGGPGRPGGFEKKDFPRKEADRKDGERPPEGDRAKQLERELQELRNRTNELEAQLKKTREGGEAKREEPKREGPPAGRPFGPGGPMGPGGFNPLGGGRGGPMGLGGFGSGDRPMGPGMNLPLENMSPEQIKQLIGRLQQVLEAKSRGGDQPKRPEGNKGDQPKKPDAPRDDQPKKPDSNRGKDPTCAEREILNRLDKLTKEVEDIRRSLKK